MSDLSESQKQTLSLFVSGADRLEKAVLGLSEDQLDYSPAPGEWTIREIVHHVAEDGDAWSMQIKRALATPGTRVHRVEGFPGNDAWASALAYKERSITASMSLLKAHRAVIAEVAVLFADEWERNLVFVDSRGSEKSLTAGAIIKMVGEHLVEHVDTIEAIKQHFQL
jgi:hypothetical protein